MKINKLDKSNILCMMQLELIILRAFFNKKTQIIVRYPMLLLYSSKSQDFRELDMLRNKDI